MARAVQWSVPPAVLAAKVNKRVEDWVRLTVISMFTRVVMRSPVDTGRFRANWLLGYGAPEVTTHDGVDPDGGGRSQLIARAVMSWPVGGIVYLTNSLPYARVLEYGEYPNPPKFGSKKRGEDGVAIHVQGGYSMQAPNGMVRVTVAEFDQASQEAAREAAA